MPPAELSLFASRRRQCCKNMHTHKCVWPPTRTGTLTARIVHTAHSSWPRTTNALATPPRTVPLSFCTTRPAAMLWLRAFAFVFRSCNKRRQLTLSRTVYYCCCCCCFVISLIWLQQQVEREGEGESNSEAGLAQFAFTWPRVSLLLCSKMPLCVRACVCVLCGEREWERERALSAKLTTDYPVAAYWSPLCCCLSADTCSVCWHKLFAIHPRSVLPDCCNCANIFRMPLWRWYVKFK